jgi:hypothetical protein
MLDQPRCSILVECARIPRYAEIRSIMISKLLTSYKAACWVTIITIFHGQRPDIDDIDYEASSQKKRNRIPRRFGGLLSYMALGIMSRQRIYV